MERMWERFDAFEDIPRLLDDIGIKQYGSLLFHDLKTPRTGTTRIARLSDIYGVPFVSMMSRANKLPSMSQARKKYPRAGREGLTYKWTQARGLDLLKRELLLLYKLRSSIIHGDRDPQSPLEQQLARTAYEALNLLMRPVY